MFEFSEMPALQSASVTLHPGRFVAKIRGKAVALTRSEFIVLYTLMQKPHTVLSRDQLTRALHGDDARSYRLVDVVVYEIRKKMGGVRKSKIEGVRWIGYKFNEDVKEITET
jgi:DNA-binding response OmpR family regulator